MYLIVGLGNPGRKYDKTRHNIGFAAVDLLASEFFDKKVVWKESKNNKCLYVKDEIGDKDVEIIKPQTYMNNSGVAVASVARKHNVSPENIIVVYDELDLPCCEVRIRQGGSSAGHNGIKSIIEHLGSDKFWRVRIGVSNDKRDKIPADKFVLKKFARNERKKLEDDILPEAVESIKDILEEN